MITFLILCCLFLLLCLISSNVFEWISRGDKLLYVDMGFTVWREAVPLTKRGKVDENEIQRY